MAKKVLAALAIVGAIVGLTYGAAASLGGIRGTEIGASDAVVVSCDTNGVRIDYSLDFTSEFVVIGATVSEIADECVGRQLRLFLTHGSDPLASGAAVVAAGGPANNTAEVTFGPVAAEDVDGVHIAIT